MGPAYGMITPEVEYGFMNGNRYTFTVSNVRDKSGEIVPDGTAVYVRYPYWLNIGGGQALFPSEGQGYYVQSGSHILMAQLITRGGTASFEAQTRYFGECWGQGASPYDVFQLIGTSSSSLEPFYARNVLATATLHYLLPPGCTPPK